jgi:NAD(P)H-flavin reductase
MDNPAPDRAAGKTAVPFPLIVRAAWDETPTLRALRLGAPRALCEQYKEPGQYLELVHPELGSGYFALAAAPALSGQADDSGELELLVRRGPGLAGLLAMLPPAGELDTHGVRGAGFSLSAQAGRDLLLLAVGSGIAPMRAVLQLLRRQRRSYGRIALYYGERDEASFAYRGELLALRELSIDVTLVLTQPPAAWKGGVGYVQSHLRIQPPPWLGPGTAALLCGQPAMVREATTLLTEHQVPTSQILLNY